MSPDILAPALLAGILAVVLFHRPLQWLLKWLARSAAGLAFLFLWSQSGILAGFTLGVNLFNALTLGLLGIPGLGLLLLWNTF